MDQSGRRRWRRPVGLGRQGPLGLRTAVVADRHRRIWRKSSAAARTNCGASCRAAISAARASPSSALAAVALWGFSGFFRVEPDELGVVLRFGQEVREVQPGLNYHLPYPVETVLTPKALRVNKIDIGMRVVDDIRRGTDHPRRAGGEPDAHRRREHRRRRLLGAVEGQADRRRRISVQHPESGRHREGGGRKRHARGGRPLRDPADPDRRASDHRDRGAGSDAEDARPLRRRHLSCSRCSCRRSIRRRR